MTKNMQVEEPLVNLSTISTEDSKNHPLLEESWQQAMLAAMRDPVELLQMLELNTEEFRQQLDYPEQFKLLAPQSYINKIRKGDWHDPLLRQIMPLKLENNTYPGYATDPVGDLHSVVSRGVLQKYQGRVLLITTGACAIHCRYCFRRHFPYAASAPDKHHWQQTLQRIRDDKNIREVILSGGDPLMLDNDRLGTMCQDLAAVDHIKTLRFHSRIPVILPERINQGFMALLDSLDIQKVMVIHVNHANEIDDLSGEVLRQLSQQGVTVLNQSVLLESINNDVESLYNLSQRLFEFQVLPYYLHLLDKVHGAAHFDVPEESAIDLVNQLKLTLPGYLVPRLVKEISGERCKHTIV